MPKIIIVCLSAFLWVVFPLVVNKSTEGRFDWIKPHLRMVWTLIFLIAALVWIFTDKEVMEAVVSLKKLLPGFQGYAVCFLTGGVILCCVWWITGKTFPTRKNDNIKIEQNDNKAITSSIVEGYSGEIPKAIVGKKESPKEANIIINNSPGSIATKNQKGDNYIINRDIPDPKFYYKYISKNIANGNFFETKILFTIDSKIMLKNVYLEARSPSIIKFKVTPQRSGMSFFGHSGTREGLAFTNVTNAWGEYILTLVSKSPEDNPEIICEYE